MKKILIIALILVFALQLMPFTASAEEPKASASAPTKLWVAPSEENGIPSQIDVFKKKTGNYNPTYTYQVYLPGNAVLANCFLSWDGGATVTINGTTYESGACPLPQVGTETTYEFKNGNVILHYQNGFSLSLICHEEFETYYLYTKDKSHYFVKGLIVPDSEENDSSYHDYLQTKKKNKPN